MDAVPTNRVGVLGVVLSDPEVTAVFPRMSSTIIPHGQEITFYRGDDLDIAIQLQSDGDPPDPVSLENSIVRWAAKQGHSNASANVQIRPVLGNSAALIYKRSYVPSEIEIVNASRGQAIVHLHREDTIDLPAVPAIWDIEVTRPTSCIDLPDDATIMATNGSDVVSAIGFDWTSLHIRNGDIVNVGGRLVMFVERLSQMHARLDWSIWEPGVLPISAYRAQTKTVARGRFVALGDVVR
jgi:hypothetical protein